MIKGILKKFIHKLKSDMGLELEEMPGIITCQYLHYYLHWAFQTILNNIH